MNAQSQSEVNVFVKANFRKRKLIFAKAQQATIGELHADVKVAHQELYPEDGEIYCQRLMLLHEGQAYAASTNSTLGGLAQKGNELHLSAVMTYLGPDMRGPETTVDGIDDDSDFLRGSGDQANSTAEIEHVVGAKDKKSKFPDSVLKIGLDNSSKSTGTHGKRRIPTRAKTSLGIQSTGLKPLKPKHLKQPDTDLSNKVEKAKSADQMRDLNVKESSVKPKQDRNHKSTIAERLFGKGSIAKVGNQYEGPFSPNGKSEQSRRESIDPKELKLTVEKCLESGGYTPSLGVILAEQNAENDESPEILAAGEKTLDVVPNTQDQDENLETKPQGSRETESANRSLSGKDSGKKSELENGKLKENIQDDLTPKASQSKPLREEITHLAGLDKSKKQNQLADDTATEDEKRLSDKGSEAEKEGLEKPDQGEELNPNLVEKEQSSDSEDDESSDSEEEETSIKEKSQKSEDRTIQRKILDDLRKATEIQVKSVEVTPQKAENVVQDEKEKEKENNTPESSKKAKSFSYKKQVVETSSDEESSSEEENESEHPKKIEVTSEIKDVAPKIEPSQKDAMAPRTEDKSAESSKQDESDDESDSDDSSDSEVSQPDGNKISKLENEAKISQPAETQNKVIQEEKISHLKNEENSSSSDSESDDSEEDSSSEEEDVNSGKINAVEKSKLQSKAGASEAEHLKDGGKKEGELIEERKDESSDSEDDESDSSDEETSSDEDTNSGRQDPDKDVKIKSKIEQFEAQNSKIGGDNELEKVKPVKTKEDNSKTSEEASSSEEDSSSEEESSSDEETESEEDLKKEKKGLGPQMPKLPEFDGGQKRGLTRLEGLPSKKKQKMESQPSSYDEDVINSEGINMSQEQELISKGKLAPGHGEYLSTLLASASQEALKKKGGTNSMKPPSTTNSELPPKNIDFQDSPPANTANPKMKRKIADTHGKQANSVKDEGDLRGQKKVKGESKSKMPKKQEKLDHKSKSNTEHQKGGANEEKKKLSGICEDVIPLLAKKYPPGKIGGKEMAKDARSVVRQQMMFEGRNPGAMYKEEPPTWWPFPSEDWNSQFMSNGGVKKMARLFQAIQDHFDV